MITITTRELKYAEENRLLPANKGIEYWWNAIDEDHPGHNDLLSYCCNRQKGRLVRLLLADGTPDPDEVYVHWFNVPNGCGSQFERIEWSEGNPEDPLDLNFERLREGHGKFIHLQRDHLTPSKASSFFINWDDFPALHNSRCLFLEGIAESCQKPENYALPQV